MTSAGPSFSWDSFKKTTPSEYLVRFAFGGAIGAVAFYVGKRFGPQIGGLLLAFPALLPAVLTLADEHEARNAAVVHARGAALGSIGLIVFALTVRLVGADHIALALLGATLAWLLSSALLWRSAIWLRERQLARDARRDGAQQA